MVQESALSAAGRVNEWVRILPGSLGVINMKSKPFAPRLFSFRIGHNAGISDYKYSANHTEWKQHWQVFPGSLMQPSSGKQKVELECPVCGNKIPFTVASPAAARASKNFFLLVSAVFFVVAIAIFSGRAEFPDVGWLVTAETALLCVPIFLSFLGLLFLVEAFDDFSRAVRMDSKTEAHKLFKPNEPV